MPFGFFYLKEGRTYEHRIDPDRNQGSRRRAAATRLEASESNDNLDNLYHPAPIEVWREFYACKESLTTRKRIKSSFSRPATQATVPPWIVAHTCRTAAALSARISMRMLR